MRTLAPLAAFALLALAPLTLPAQKSPAPATPHHVPEAAPELRFTLILSRHGIRPPLTPAVFLNTFSTQPWPGWDVPLGHLTAHGAQALTLMGTYLRADAARSGLFPATGCPAASDIYLYADTDERNIASTRATFNAFAPNCPHLPVFTFAGGLKQLPSLRDPFFLPLEGTFLPPPFREAMRHMTAGFPVSMQAALSATDTPAHQAALEEMQRILAPDPAHPPVRTLHHEDPHLLPNPLGDPIVISRGPLPSASALIENLELEYADGKPMSDVGWGRADAATIRRLMPLHIAAFGYSHRTRYIARIEASNTLLHILDTLDQAALNKPVRGALGPPGTRLVYISGHDTNLVGIGGLLGLHWHADGRTDDTPPDSQLVFELWQQPGARNLTLRLRYRAQTLDQLRNLTPLTPQSPPAEATLTPTGCPSPTACPYPRFHHAAKSMLNLRYTKPDLLATHVAPEN